MSKLKFLCQNSLFGAASAALGAIAHSVAVDGGASLTQFVGSGSLAAGAIAVFLKLATDWKAAGGKLDGQISDREATAAIDSVADSLKLPAGVKSAAEHFAAPLASAGNQLIARVEQTVPGATDLIGLVSKYLDQHADAPDPDHTALLWKCVDVASHAITGDVAGEDAAALLRQRLDVKLFPGSPALPIPSPK